MLDDPFELAPEVVKEAPTLSVDDWREARLGRPVAELVELSLLESGAASAVDLCELRPVAVEGSVVPRSVDALLPAAEPHVLVLDLQPAACTG